MTNIELQTLAAVKEAARTYTHNADNWRQRRFDTSVALLSALVSKYGMAEKETLVKTAIDMADMLIKFHLDD